MTDQKIFLSAFAKGGEWKKEAGNLAAEIRKDFGNKSCDLVIFFVSESYKDFDPKIFSEVLSEKTQCFTLIGCNSSGVITTEKEIEMEPAISVLAMHLPGVKIFPFYLPGGDSTAMKSGAELINAIDIYPPDKPRFVCLADPASCDISQLLNLFNDAYKGMSVIGGLASGGVMGADNWLALNGVIYSEGAVGVGLTGNIEFDILVSQGCRPIGKPFVITKAQDNILYELAGRPALHAAREVLEGLPPKDKALAEHSLFVGLVMEEQRTEFKRGDFLIRNIMGFDPESGAFAIGATLKVGHTLQFQLRDAETSEEDLRILLDKLGKAKGASPQGGLLVSCCGRGKGLFGQPDHDARLIQSMRGPLPLTGFFANGEIGPVGNKNYVHGYTSSLVILR